MAETPKNCFYLRYPKRRWSGVHTRCAPLVYFCRSRGEWAADLAAQAKAKTTAYWRQVRS